MAEGAPCEALLRINPRGRVMTSTSANDSVRDKALCCHYWNFLAEGLWFCLDVKIDDGYR